MTNVQKLTMRPHSMDSLCRVAPHPEVAAMLRAELNTLRASAGESTAAASLSLHKPKILGFDDGTILPPEDFELGTSSAIMGAAAASRAPLRGDLRVIVVLVQFPDAQITRSKSEFETLFFTAGTNSVADFFSEASGGLVSIKGEIVGPYTLPRNLSEYANNSSGTGRIAPNAQTMAFDAATAAMAEVDQSLDNDGNGLVDAFIVVHAGRAAEETNNKSDIWSHKWVLPTGAISAPDGTRIYAYLTVPEDARVGVCAHELGHLVFGWPDLYDTDGSSEGVGNWCLMGGGSWNGAGVEAFRPGDVPSQPSAWCKATQGWVDVVVQKRNAQVTISDVGKSRTIYRMWKDGTMASEYFLVENRQREGFDRGLPSSGLLIWHIDDSITSNTNDSHYKVALLQADGRRDLERAANRGDAGDPYPDNSRNSNFDAESNPSSRSYSGMATSVAVTAIPASSRDMSVRLSVTPDSTARRRTVTRKDKPTREGSLT